MTEEEKLSAILEAAIKSRRKASIMSAVQAVKSMNPPFTPSQLGEAETMLKCIDRGETITMGLRKAKKCSFFFLIKIHIKLCMHNFFFSPATSSLSEEFSPYVLLSYKPLLSGLRGPRFGRDRNVACTGRGARDNGIS